MFAVGQEGETATFDYRGYAIERSFLGVTDTPGYGDARAIAATVMEAYAAGRGRRGRGLLDPVPIA